jgi:5-dehydro-2-deoxygluconokinase
MNDPTTPAAGATTPDDEATPTSGAGTQDRLLMICAIDHRASLERDMYGLTAPPSPAEAARIASDKLLVYQALLDAVEQLPATVQPGILIDEEYGATAAELATRSLGAVALAMPIEASGEEWFEFAYGSQWRTHAEFFPADYAKVLVRDNPGSDPGARAGQAERLAEVSEWSAQTDRPLILELLVPATDDDLAKVARSSDRYDDEIRPRLTVQSMEFLQDHGVEPAIWKVEGLDRRVDAEAVVRMAQRGGRRADCIVLGRHAPHDKLDHWLGVAAPVPGFTGFAIGRSIWWDALHAQLHHRSTAGEARRRITRAYLDFVTYYLEARDGRLPGRLADTW